MAKTTIIPPMKGFFLGLLAAAILAPVTLATSGCSTTRYHERAKLADHCMQLDADPALVFIRTKTEGAREAAFGGYGRSPAGGCGCE